MKAFILNSYKPQNGLQLVDVSEPELKENDILIKVFAAGVNLLDSKIKAGEFKPILSYELPVILGHDVAGVVVKTGALVKNFKIGDEVYSRPRDYRIGTFAEFIAIDANDAALKPEEFSMTEAASIPLVGLTAWQALVEKADLKKGQKVFIQAGSGGVGTFAIQLAKYIGATVATTTSTANIELVKSLGADIVIDYKNEDFETILKDYDVVLNSQDSKTLEKSLRILKPNGKLISISGPPDIDFAKEIKLNSVMKIVMFLLSYKAKKQAKKLGVNFSFLFMKASGEHLTQITSILNLGHITPVVDKVFPFEETNKALAYVENGRAKGKVVIKIN